jgi:hypothetical protein
MQSYKKVFGEELPIENASWEQREYAFKEAEKKTVAGERGAVTAKELQIE